MNGLTPPLKTDLQNPNIGQMLTIRFGHGVAQDLVTLFIPKTIPLDTNLESPDIKH